MKLAELFTKKSENGNLENGSQLNDLLDKILVIEKRRDAAEAELENARRHLQNEQARDIDGDADADLGVAAAGVVAEKEKLDGLENLLKKAKDKGIATIAANHANQQARLTECEAELVEVRATIDVRKIKTISTFAKKHGLRVDWPSKTGGGVIHLPAMVLDGEELIKIADAVATPVHVDDDATLLEQLLAERQRLNVVIRSQPDMALEHLLGERRR
jgi:hypothetical protein